MLPDVRLIEQHRSRQIQPAEGERLQAVSSRQLKLLWSSCGAQSECQVALKIRSEGKGMREKSPISDLPSKHCHLPLTSLPTAIKSTGIVQTLVSTTI
jgi:hypothetical protein